MTPRFLLARTLLVAAVLAGGACGQVGFLEGMPGPPTIQGLAAAPPSLPADGGTSTLSWTVQDAKTLVLEPGVGSVAGRTQVDVALTATTTYTLTAGNEIGQDAKSVTVTVGP